MIELNDACFRYPNGRKDVLRNLTLTIKPGYIYGLLGKNGEGKSTLFKVLNGLLFLKQGNVMVNGYNAAQREASFLADIFLVPEEFALPKLKPMQYKVLFSPFYPKFNPTIFEEVMTDFQIDKNQVLNKMSFGQRKKFLIAFALATEVSVLLMDEPTNGLDIPSKATLRKLLVQHITAEKTCIISTHQARDLESIIARLVILNDGELLFNDAIDVINQKFCAIKNPSKAEEDALYSLQDAGGFVSLLTKTEDRAGEHVDLELFFSALISNVNFKNLLVCPETECVKSN